jgi:hypothetical protein
LRREILHEHSSIFSSRYHQVYLLLIALGFIVWGFLIFQVVQRTVKEDSSLSDDLILAEGASNNAVGVVEQSSSGMSVNEQAMATQESNASPESIKRSELNARQESSTKQKFLQAASASKEALTYQELQAKPEPANADAPHLAAISEKLIEASLKEVATQQPSKPLLIDNSDTDVHQVLKQIEDSTEPLITAQLIDSLRVHNAPGERQVIDQFFLGQLIRADVEPDECHYVAHLHPVIDDYNEGLYLDTADRLKSSFCAKQLRLTVAEAMGKAVSQHAQADGEPAVKLR